VQQRGSRLNALRASAGIRMRMVDKRNGEKAALIHRWSAQDWASQELRVRLPPSSRPQRRAPASSGLGRVTVR